MSESKLQSKILAWLKKEGFYVFKTILCNRNGIPDIIGCTPEGRFFAIEVKYGNGKATPLQLWNLEQIESKGGIAILAYDLESVKSRLAERTTVFLPPSA